jgi:PucR family transcriptional regulator, purine catabolism regulatory protein
VRVADLLGLPAFAAVEVVSGRTGLDRRVSRANIMEVPDILPWVKPQELLLATGYPMRDVPSGLAGLVAGLDDSGVAALGVKLRRYLDELPADMLAEAERRSFPLLLLPDHLAFDDILNAVLATVLHRQSFVQERSELVHGSLVSIVLEGGELDELVEALHSMTSDPTLVTTSDGRVLAAAGDPEAQHRLRHTALFDPSGRFRTERFPPGLHQTQGFSVAAVPVVAAKTDHGRLVAVRSGHALGDGDLQVLERAATVVALVVTKTLAVRAVEAKYRGDFVRDVLHRRAGSVDQVVAHCESLGWDIARPMVVVVSQLDLHQEPADRTPLQIRTAQDRFVSAWVNIVSRHDKTAPVVGFASEVVTLVPVPAGDAARDVVERLVRMVAGDGGGGRNTFATGVSRIVPDPGGIPIGYEQGRRAVQVGRQMQGPSAVAHFDDLGAFRLLSLIEDTDELHAFVGEVLGGLADADSAEAADMRATLLVLLDTNINVAEASRRLHFHYNTLRYRISKLERIVGRFTEDPRLRLDLALALRVMQMKGL